MPAELWLDVRLIGFDELDRQLLALALYYELDDRLEHQVDRISAARGDMSQLRCDVTLIALLLDDEPGAIETRLRAEGRLYASGRLRVSRDGDLDVISQLGALVRAAVAPKQDPFEQLLGRTIPSTLPWDAFAHLGREADIAAALLTTAVASREPGVNILLYGPPGTGKTSFAATLAARAGAGLRPVTEQDRPGGAAPHDHVPGTEDPRHRCTHASVAQHGRGRRHCAE
jgi:transitional endoplasmic reticulum ATPase